MTQFFGSRLGVSVLLGALGIFTATLRASAESDNEAPLPKTQPLPAASSSDDGKKYDLRYKLAMGDVLRYEVTHRASIQSTIEQSTQAAQTKTDSIKNWKVTD